MYARWKPVAVVTALLATLCALPALAQTYQIDPVHTSLVFRVKHMNTAFVYGMFRDVKGTVVVDEANPARSSINIEVDANSVFTANEQRDNHLRSPDFFNARQFPTITFRSTSIRRVNADTVQVQGNLTMRGVTRPVTATVNLTGKGKNAQGRDIIGFETTFTIRRSEFGIRYGLPGLGDEVRVTLSVEAIRQ
ncbi:MAG: YceI family protein [Armatimonadota bacterium]|nr:YceI family protein [bacterium]MCS7310437.1 YceI family protein [Armatimonadota bacterium]MDW8105529.1 YceI family protein [Armatimonadota bacterium]MDW8291236.1 YceI family protein [Armatimonadota bacterium]